MKCPNCGAENVEGVRFCNYCGKEIAQARPAAEPAKTARCPNCGFNNVPGAVFCNQCGKDLRSVITGPTVSYPLPNTKPCVSCGRMIPMDANLCPYCRYNYRGPQVQQAPPAMAPLPVPPAPPGAGATKNCVSCGRVIPFDANLCPYCRYSYQPPQPPQPMQPQPFPQMAPQQPQYPPQQPQQYQPYPQPQQAYQQYQFPPQQMPPQQAGLKPCVSCGRMIPVDANMCPYCTYKYRK